MNSIPIAFGTRNSMWVSGLEYFEHPLDRYQRLVKYITWA